MAVSLIGRFGVNYPPLHCSVDVAHGLALSRAARGRLAPRCLRKSIPAYRRCSVRRNFGPTSSLGSGTTGFLDNKPGGSSDEGFPRAAISECGNANAFIASQRSSILFDMRCTEGASLEMKRGDFRASHCASTCFALRSVMDNTCSRLHNCSSLPTSASRFSADQCPLCLQ